MREDEQEISQRAVTARDFLVFIWGRELGYLPARRPTRPSDAPTLNSPEGTTTVACEIGARRGLTPPTGPICDPGLGPLMA